MRIDALPIVYIDFETYWADDYTLSSMPTQAYIQDQRFRAHGACVAVNDGPIKWVDHDVLGPALRALAEAYPSAIWVAHNALFDMTILALVYGVRPRFVADTAAMSRAIIGPRLNRHSLDNMSELLLGESKSKALVKSLGVKVLAGQLLQEIAEYCKRDVDLMRRCFKLLAPHFPAKELEVMTWVTEMMTKPLIQFDEPMLVKYYESVVGKREETISSIPISQEDREQFPKLTDIEIQRKLLMSNAMFAELLRANGAVPPLKLNAKGKEFLDSKGVTEDSLSYQHYEALLHKKLATYALAKTDEGLKVLLEHENLSVQSLVAARLDIKSTIEETRSRVYSQLAPLGSICVPIAYSGAIATHRFSGRDALNFQNLRRGGVIRNSIIPPDGHGFVVSDLSQIELRITLYLAGHIDDVVFLNNGGDLYSVLASKLYGTEVKKGVKEHEEKRHVGKEATLGCGFGMGHARFQTYMLEKSVSVTSEFAKAAVKLYRGSYPGVPKLWKLMERSFSQLLETSEPFDVELGGYKAHFGYEPMFNSPGMRLPNGLWVKYPDLARDENGQWAYDNCGTPVRIFGGHFLENLVQALARNIMAEKSVRANRKYPVKMSTHDELTAVVRRDTIDQAQREIHDIMISPVDWLPGLPIGSETKSGYRYGAIK